MARINVEDSLFKDQRFMDLVIETKNADLALGALIRCWMVGQSFWKNSDNGIPKSEWVKQRLNDAIIKCGLAEDRGDFVFVIGAPKNFAWVRDLSEAGKRGGLKSKGNFPSQAKPSEPSLLSSPSSLLSSPNSISKKTTKATGVAIHPLAELWNFHGQRGILPLVKASNAARNRKAASRWKETPPGQPPEVYWRDVIQLIAGSSFCRGENDRGWRATFDWLLQPETHLKVLEGKYENRSKGSSINTKPLTMDELL